MDRTPTYVSDVLDAAHELVSLADGLSVQAFINDRMRCLAVEKLFIDLGEASRRIDPDRAAAIPGVPWGRVIGLRNILAHGYEQIEHEVLFKTISSDLPGLIVALETWLDAQPAPLDAGRSPRAGNRPNQCENSPAQVERCHHLPPSRSQPPNRGLLSRRRKSVSTT